MLNSSHRVLGKKEAIVDVCSRSMPCILHCQDGTVTMRSMGGVASRARQALAQAREHPRHRSSTGGTRRQGPPANVAAWGAGGAERVTVTRRVADHGALNVRAQHYHDGAEQRGGQSPRSALAERTLLTLEAGSLRWHGRCLRCEKRHGAHVRQLTRRARRSSHGAESRGGKQRKRATGLLRAGNT